ncbi:META domain-containing protein [uncultured Deinococcus sp.]|uniref:META domain-containing protein n=1 Tax=uncultured Deinococcus sp. TaxID=158789 RepID=UPI002589456A|nr:META domain-containing protein [uncultured Deinococcus sp.]
MKTLLALLAVALGPAPVLAAGLTAPRTAPVTAPGSVPATTAPAPLNGIWRLVGEVEPDGLRGGVAVRPQLVISGDRVSGQLGCGRFTGTVQATGSEISLKVTALPPRANERCLFAIPGNFYRVLNAADHYVINGSTQRLVLFSDAGRLTFERVGYVTPVRR